MMTSQ
jgi:5'-AMP-activated protein kinase catalytic alpha subunit